MMKPIKLLLVASIAASFGAAPLVADESFGFGADSVNSVTAADSAQSVMVGGSVDISARMFYDAMNDMSAFRLGDLASANVYLKASASNADALIKLKLSKALLSDGPSSVIDEAKLSVFLGPASLEGGLMKLAWGKADSLGPLNVLNPMNYTDLTVTDEREQRIAEPMLHASLSLGDFSKLELAFLPGFEGDRYAWEGRWTPNAISSQKSAAYSLFYYGTNPTANGGKGDGLYASYYTSAWSAVYSAAYAQAYATAYATAYAQYFALTSDAAQSAVNAGANAASQANTSAMNAAESACAAQSASLASQAATAANARVADLLDYPDTRTLEYAQGGARFTTTLGPVDLGLQYFYGFLPKPVASVDPAVLAANGYRVPISYNRYHQAGLDLAAVLLGFNLRGELAANLTDDVDGDDPGVYNPALAFSLGFDRDLIDGINFNAQYAGSYRLFDEKATTLNDIESGLDPLSSKFTFALSQSLFKDALEWRLTALWGLEDADYLVMPSLVYNLGDAELELSAGIFGGDAAGELGQFNDSSYVKVGMRYSF